MHQHIVRLIAAVLILTSTGFLMANAQKKKGKKGGNKDVKAMQGTWTAKQGPLSAEMTIKGSKFRFTMDHDGKKATAFGTFKLNTKKNPKTIDMKIVKGEGEDIQKYVGKTAHGIYKISGDMLTWCSNEPGNEGRPTEFKMDEEKHMLLNFTRKKN